MASLKKILEAARLIERTDGEPAVSGDGGTGGDDIDAIIRRAAEADSRPAAPAGAPAAAAPSSADAPAPAAVEEGLAFADIYARQGVVEAGFPVERLFKLVEGLRTLDPTTRRAAINAMDAADDTWSMAQVLSDADTKIAALRGHQRDLQTTADTLVKANQDRIASLETQRDSRLAELREQISALEAKIQEAVGSTAADVARLQSESESNKAALTRENQRLEAYILNLEELAAQFRAQAP